MWISFKKFLQCSPASLVYWACLWHNTWLSKLHHIFLDDNKHYIYVPEQHQDRQSQGCVWGLKRKSRIFPTSQKHTFCGKHDGTPLSVCGPAADSEHTHTFFCWMQNLAVLEADTADVICSSESLGPHSCCVYRAPHSHTHRTKQRPSFLHLLASEIIFMSVPRENKYFSSHFYPSLSHSFNLYASSGFYLSISGLAH